MCDCRGNYLSKNLSDQWDDRLIYGICRYSFRDNVDFRNNSWAGSGGGEKVLKIKYNRGVKELKKDTKEIIFELIRLNAPRGVQVELKENTTFFGDLKYDSLALISLLADVEEEFQLEFDDMEESLEAFETVHTFIEFVDRYMEGE